MKNIKVTGEWNGEKIWREESPEETLARKMKEEGLELPSEEIVKLTNLFIALQHGRRISL